jgi:phage shock protein PspC (stress-responsive transcriptional regulator)
LEVRAVRERLYRSRTDRVLFGVAGGMADWLDVDPSVVRLVWALLVVFGGAGLILYIIAAIVIPEEPWAVAAPGMAPATGEPGAAPAPGMASTTDPRAEWRAARAARRAERGNNAGIIFGVILILAGAWFLLKSYVPLLDDRWLWPGILVVIGVLLVVAAMRRPSPPRS